MQKASQLPRQHVPDVTQVPLYGLRTKAMGIALRDNNVIGISVLAFLAASTAGPE